jgi:Tfp pilus assembly protein PilF
MTKPNASAYVEDLLFQAELLVDLREWKSADEVFRKALVLDKSPASRIAYGVCLAEQERYFEAISTFTPVLDGTNRAAIGIVCHNLAAIYRDVGDADLARRFQWRATLSEDHADESDLLGMANDAQRHRAERACVVRAIRCFEMAPAPHSYRNARIQLDRLDQMQSIRSFDVRRN